jgi:prevent-host-death family protein
MVFMRTVSVSELKAHLSRYIREVRRGGEVQVLDRGVPVARLTGLAATAGEGGARRERLIRAGVLRPGSGDASVVLQSRPLDLSADLSEALDEERKSRL